MLTICQKNWLYERLRRPDTTFRDASQEAASMVKTKKVLIGKNFLEDSRLPLLL